MRVDPGPSPWTNASTDVRPAAASHDIGVKVRLVKPSILTWTLEPGVHETPRSASPPNCTRRKSSAISSIATTSAERNSRLAAKSDTVRVNGFTVALLGHGHESVDE
jgi:hypothetical protein